MITYVQSQIIIETKRLLLRKWKEEDLASFYLINSSEAVCQFLPKILTRDESDSMARRINDEMEKNGFGLYGVEEKSSAKFIGYIGLSVPNFKAHFTPCVEIGWRLSPDHWGKGYATEGALAIKEYAFNELKLDEIVSFTVAYNIRSRRVMEKIGMIYDSRDDFLHPNLPEDHKLSKHVLYRFRLDPPMNGGPGRS